VAAPSFLASAARRMSCTSPAQPSRAAAQQTPTVGTAEDQSRGGCGLGRRARPQLPVLHLLDDPGRLRPTQQAAHVAQARAEAHAAHAHAAPEAVGALHELVRVLGALAVQRAPLAGAAAHVARRRARAQALAAQRHVRGVRRACMRAVRPGWVRGPARALGRRQGRERRRAHAPAGPTPAAAVASPGAASAARLAAPSSTAWRRPVRGAGGATEGAAGCAGAAWCAWWWSPAGSPALVNVCQAGGGSLVNAGTFAHRKRCMPTPEAAWPVAAPAHSAGSAPAMRVTQIVRISLGPCACDLRARRRSSRSSRPAAL
jgi:hypothetical protein